MLNRLKELKLNKNGMSMIELIVTLGIAGVIVGMLGMFIAQSSLLFKNQSAIVDLTNEAQMISEQLEQSIMEATALTIEKKGDITFIYTGIGDSEEGKWVNGTGVERTFIISDGKIYISTKFCQLITDVSDANLISAYGKSFDIKVSEKSKEYETDEAGVKLSTIYLNPIMVEVNFELEFDDTTKKTSLVLKLRNDIEHCIEK